MTIGTPWGETFDNGSEHLLAQHRLFGRQEDVPITPKSNYIDHDHDVPFLAASLIHPDTGEHYGTAIDRRIPHWATIAGLTFKPGDFVDKHENKETEEMQKNKTPYVEAHDKIATPHEKGLFQNFAKENKKDPDEAWKEYQAWWASHTKTTTAQDPEKVHPHTWLEPYKQTNPGLYDKMVNALEKTRNFMNEHSPGWETGLQLLGPNRRFIEAQPVMPKQISEMAARARWKRDPFHDTKVIKEFDKTPANENNPIDPKFIERAAAFYDKDPQAVARILKGYKGNIHEEEATQEVRKQILELPSVSKYGRESEVQQKRRGFKVVE